MKSEQMESYVISMRERFFALADDAITSVQKALQAGDSELGYQLLKDVGIVPSKQWIPIENAEPINDQDDRVRGIMVKMAAIAVERNRVFKTPFPRMDAVEKEIEDELERQKQEEE